MVYQHQETFHSLQSFRRVFFPILLAFAGAAAALAQDPPQPIPPPSQPVVQDREATARARSYFTGYEPSSPSIALLRNGEVVYMLERSQIEGKDAPEIAENLIRAFDQFCATGAQGAEAAD